MTARRTGYDGSRWRVEVLPDDPPSVVSLLGRLERDVAEGHRMPPTAVVLQRLIDAGRRDDGLPTAAMLKRLQILARQCGLKREERLELAEVILRRDVTTWSGLTQAEAVKLTTAMEGFGFIAHLQAQQGARWRYAACSASPCPMRPGG